MNRYGLIGRNISYSFSRHYFQKKFTEEGINAVYENFDLPDLSQLPEILREHGDLRGLNVTIPYKEAIFKYLSTIDPIAANIGAVNTIKIGESGRLRGFNTDYYGFSRAIQPHLKSHHKQALILGTGGASKAVQYALRTLHITPTFVSRKPPFGNLNYTDLSEALLKEYLVIINTTPLGTYPETDQYPAVPIKGLTSKHLIFDLVYNPPKTKFMRLAEAQGATVVNGSEMLKFQAEKAWEIWNNG